MKALLAALALVGGLIAVPRAWAGPGLEVQTLYMRFLEAQDARDLGRVRDARLEFDKLLWVSDGMAVWGPDAVLQRMALFQKAEV